MTYLRTGTEFVANKTTSGTQQLTGLIPLGGQKFAVEYYDSSDPSHPQYLARVFDGTTGGTETKLGSASPAIALTDGRLVELVEDSFTHGTISAQFLTSGFAASGPPVTLFSDTTGGFYRLISPSAAALSTGGFAVSVATQQTGGFTSSLYVQTFDSTGKAIGDAIHIGDGGINGESDMAILADGRIAVFNHDAHAVSIFAADLAGTPTVITIDTSMARGSSTPAEAKMVALKDGTFAVIWDENLSSSGYFNVGALHAQVFDGTGKAISGDIIVSTDGPSTVGAIDIAALANGDFAVAWSRRGATDSDIAVRTYSAAGDEIGFEQIVNTKTANQQYDTKITALADGGFVVGWTDGMALSDPTVPVDVRAQVFASNAGQTVTGTSGADKLVGTAKDDVLIGLAGDDILNGKLGNDTASYEGAAAGVTLSLAVIGMQNTGGAGKDTLIGIENLTGSRFGDTLTGDQNSNILIGHGGNDQLQGGRGIDRLVGGGGADMLNGGAGADTMIGGTGNDLYYVDNKGDQVIESLAKDPVTGKPLGGTDTVTSLVSYKLPDFVENLVLDTRAGAINGTGNARANSIVGNDSNNVLFGGGSGADRLTGGLGADTFKLNYANERGVPVITDFTPGADHIQIPSNPYFAFYGREDTTLTDADLAFGGKATTPDQHLIYSAITGTLWYDPDGVGGQAQVKIAVLLGHPDLHASDIDIIFI